MRITALVLALASAPVAYPEDGVDFHTETKSPAVAEPVEDETREPRLWEFDDPAFLGNARSRKPSVDGGIELP